ncbi:MAG: pyridoxamine 5'-phosphate oxidase family protein [Parcubacteria group bacterium]|nr:pyridoxamine 5'-phosphate oxidase family protein [Parcubacteria group bacterium]
MNEQKKQVLDFLRRHKAGVLATVSPEGHPEAAAVEYGSTDTLELVFDTFVMYRKYTNLQANPRIAFVVWDGDKTVQYEGTAAMVSDKETLQELKGLFFSQVPEAKKFEALEATRFFKVSPTWIRYKDYAISPDPLFELTF